MKILVIGYGSIGSRHVRVLETLDNNYEIQIVSSQDISKYKVFGTLEEVDDIQSFDYFVIASITVLHENHLRYINSKVKGKKILVEKPLAINYFDIEKKNQIFIAYNLRFHQVLQSLKGLLTYERVLSVNIQSGQYLPDWRPFRNYSETYSADITLGGGVLFDLSHELDYLIWLFGDIKTCQSVNEKISNLKISSDDYCSVIGETIDGVKYNLSIDYLLRKPKRELVINTEEHTIYADLITNKIEICSTKEDSEVKEYIMDSNLSYIKMHECLISGNTRDIASFGDGIKVLKFIERIRG